MDLELDRRWRNKLPPFDGITIYPPDYLPLPVARAALTAIIEFLQTEYGQSRLFQLADWHELDGFISVPQATSWVEVRSWLVSDAALSAASPGDTWVYRGLYSEAGSFYLRFYIPEERDQPYPSERVPYANFDVTCKEPLAARLMLVAEKANRQAMRRQRAKEYFDQRYSG